MDLFNLQGELLVLLTALYSIQIQESIDAILPLKPITHEKQPRLNQNVRLFTFLLLRFKLLIAKLMGTLFDVPFPYKERHSKLAWNFIQKLCSVFTMIFIQYISWLPFLSFLASRRLKTRRYFGAI